jgi:hypothetical protein
MPRPKVSHIFQRSRKPRLHAETVALKLARILISGREPGRNPFFLEGARALLAGLMTAFFLDSGEMYLRDVQSVLRTKEGMRQVLQRHPQTQYLVELFFPSEYVFHEIRAVLTDELARHERIAGLRFRP